MFVVAGEEGEGLAESFFGVAVFLLDEVVSSLSEQIYYGFVDLFEGFESVTRGGFDDLFGLGNADFLESDACLLLDHVHQLLLFQRIERDTRPRAPSSRRPSTPMNICFSVLWWLDLHY